ncbi:DUF2887 domain-containing protein [Ectothiorhodospiraceae bacterium BW-2]|nr:DUF2887 domain-containing protein [Ectothiorhodospiraceae bacterium BW-2]
MKTDHYLYRLFSHYPEALFELTGQTTPDCHYHLHAEEVKQTSMRLDGILTPDSLDAPLLFLENQFYRDSDFYARWFASIMLCFKQQRYQGHWQAVVIYPDSRFDAGLDSVYQPFETAGVLHRLYLEEILAPAATESTTHRSAETLFILQLLSLLSVDTTDQQRLAVQSQGVLQNFKPTPKISRIDAIDFVETLLIYKLPDFDREEIRAMLQIPTTDLRHTRFYKEVYDEGSSDGRTEALIDTSILLLQHRFGDLDGHQQQKISSLSYEQLRELTQSLLDFNSLDELNEWLAVKRQ